MDEDARDPNLAMAAAYFGFDFVAAISAEAMAIAVRVARSIPCPDCGAAVGEPCGSRPGDAPFYHAGRGRKAAGREGN